MPYTVHVTRNADGRRIDLEQADDWPDVPDVENGALFRWTEGNESCDCTLARLVAKALGEPEPNVPCGESAFRLHGITANGKYYPAEDVALET